MALCIFRTFNTRQSVGQKLVRLSSQYAIQEDENFKQNFVQRKFYDLNNWYIQFTGLDEVKRLQQRVINTQEKLEKAQEERREIGKLLVEIRKRSTDLQEQLLKVRRWEEVQKFLDLTREETEVIKQEKELSAQFELLDKTEREIFTALSNAVRDSHEKEKIQQEVTKYWSIILSIIGTLIGAVASSVISTIRNRQLVKGINKDVEEKFKVVSQLIDEVNGIKVGQIQNLVGQIQTNNQKQLEPLHQRLSELTLIHKTIDDRFTKLTTALNEIPNVSTKQLNNFTTQIQKDNFNSLQLIYQKLNENQKGLMSIVQSLKSENLLTTDKIKASDKALDVTAFIRAQRNLLEAHQSEMKNIMAQNQTQWNSPSYLLLCAVSGLVLSFIYFGRS